MTTLGLPGIHVPVLPRADGEEADSDDQHTPRWLVDLLSEFWPRGIGTDPCWSPHCLVQARQTYDGSCHDQDGLARMWIDDTWVNGPYSDLAPWADLAASHHEATDSDVLFLANVATSTKWFRRHRPVRGGAAYRCRAVAFFDRRISFIKDGAERPGNNRDQMMLAWIRPSRLRRFRQVFGPVAWIAT